MDGLATLELGELLAEKLPVNRFRMVEVVVAFLFVRRIREVFIIGILRDDDHPLILKSFLDGADDRRLTGARTTGDTDYQHILFCLIKTQRSWEYGGKE